MAKTERDWICLDSSGIYKQALLTDRQKLVFRCIANGLRAEEIAFELGCSVAMIRKHEVVIRKKLGAKTNAHAVARILMANQ